MVICHSFTKKTKLDIYTKLGNFLLSTVSGLISLNLYTKHMIRIKIYQMFLKHVVDSTIWEVGSPMFSLVSKGVLSLGFNCSRR